MKKRLSAILLAVCLALTLLPATVFAENAADTSWYNTTDAAFTLDDEADLLGFASIVNGTADGIAKDNFQNKTVTLGDDMDLAGIDWTPISSFAGTFDGNKKTIYRLTLDADTTTDLGLFQTLSAATVQDLTLDTVTITADRAIKVGGIAYRTTTGSTMLNCHVKNITIAISATTGRNNYIGGLVGGFWDAGKVEDCSVENFTLTARNNCYGVGGLIGRFFISSAETGKYAGSLKNCKVTGFTANIAELAGHKSGGAGCNDGGDFGGVGGMLGYGHSGSDSSALPIENCHVSKLNITVGKMYDHSFVGGYDDGAFRPHAAVSRQQVAAILWRFAKYAGMDVSVGEDTNILSYNDAFDVSEYAIPALQWACGANVLGGNNGNLLPYSACTRAQIATMLYRLLAE